MERPLSGLAPRISVEKYNFEKAFTEEECGTEIEARVNSGNNQRS